MAANLGYVSKLQEELKNERERFESLGGNWNDVINRDFSQPGGGPEVSRPGGKTANVSQDYFGVNPYFGGMDSGQEGATGGTFTNQDLNQFQELLNRLTSSKMTQQKQRSKEGRKDIYAGGLASMMSNF